MKLTVIVRSVVATPTDNGGYQLAPEGENVGGLPRLTVRDAGLVDRAWITRVWADRGAAIVDQALADLIEGESAWRS